MADRLHRSRASALRHRAQRHREVPAHVLRVLAGLVLRALVGELAIGPAYDIFARTGSAYAPIAAVVLVPCLVGATATAVALLVLPVKAVR